MALNAGGRSETPAAGATHPTAGSTRPPPAGKTTSMAAYAFMAAWMV